MKEYKVKQLTADPALQKEFVNCLESRKTDQSGESIYKLAECYKKLDNSIYNEEMARLYLESAKAGYPKAQNEAGQCYEKGIGVEINMEKAVEYYKASADQGYAPAQINLANCYYNNREALYVAYLTKAINQNSADAAYRLGNYYISKENPKLAKEYYQKAAKLGHEGAAKSLNGKIGKFLWWCKAHKEGLTFAASMLIGALFIGGLIALAIFGSDGTITPPNV